MYTQNKWFTLVELILTITILAILATVGFIYYGDSVRDARDFRRVSDVTSIKVALDSYQKKRGGLYYRPSTTSTGIVYSWSVGNVVSYQMDLNESVAWMLGMPKVPTDPLMSQYYVYAVSNHGLTYQVSTTLEKADSPVAYLPGIDQAYAAACSNRYAYVEGNFVPKSMQELPSLLYAFDHRGGNFDVAVLANRKKAVINDQNMNLTYDENGRPFSCTTPPEDILAKSVPVNADLSATKASCSYSGAAIADGDNHIVTLAGTSTGSQIGWKYKTCSDGALSPNATATGWYYACKNIPGALMDQSCTWNWCKVGYLPYTASGSAECRFEWTTVLLAYPGQGAFGVPKTLTLAWYPAQGGNGNYTLYVSTDPALEGTAYPTGSNMSYSMPDLTSATTYYWKVKTTSAANPAKALSSEIRSFTVAGTYAAGGGSGSTIVYTGSYVAPPWMDPCPSGTVCRADETYISYVWWNGVGYGKWDFGESRRTQDVLYGDVGTSVYKMENKSDGLVKFKIKMQDTSSGTTDATWKYLTKATWFDSSSAVDIWGNDGTKNLYLDLGSDCIDQATNTYEIKAKTTCVVKFYYRSDVAVAARLGYNEWSHSPFRWFIENADSLNSNWHSNSTTTNGQGDTNMTYTQSASPVPMSVDSIDFQVDLRIAYDSVATGTGAGFVSTGTYTFGQSPRYMDTQYGTENTLRYRLENNSLASAYFKVKTADASSGTTSSTVLAYLQDATSFTDPAVLNIGGDTRETKNYFYTRSADCVLDPKWYRILPGKTCYLDFHGRSDEAVSIRNSYTTGSVAFAKFFVENTEAGVAAWRNPGGVNDPFATSGNPVKLNMSGMDGYMVDLAISWISAGTGSVKHDFWASAKDGLNFYGTDKLVRYSFANRRNGIAYFKIKLADAFGGTIYGTGAQTWSGLTYTPSLSSYADSLALDIGGEKILNSTRWASNLYWDKSAECQVDATYGYKIVGNQTCTVTFHGRADPFLATFTGASVDIAKFSVENTYPVYTKWLNSTGANNEYTNDASPVLLKMRSSGFRLPNLNFAYLASSKESAEPATDAGSGSFGTSTRSTSGATILPTDRAYWKALVYRITNTGNIETFFQVRMAGGASSRLTVPFSYFDPLNQRPTPSDAASADAIFNQWTVVGKLLNIGSDAKNNFYYNNGDLSNANLCPIDGGGRGFTLAGDQYCDITMYYRGDISVPGAMGTIMQIDLEHGQEVSYNDTWQTPVFPFTGQTYGFAFPHQKYVLSETFGWFLTNLIITGTMIEGYATSESLGHICFDAKCGAQISRDAVSGSLQWFAVSEVFGWIKVDNVIMKQSNYSSWYAVSESAGWIRF